MILYIIKTILIIALLFLVYQDFKDRMVWFFLPVVVGVIGSYLFFRNSELDFYLFCIEVNLILVSAIIAVLFCVSKFILKKNFFREAFGLADVLMYVGLAISFPTISFIVFYLCAIAVTLVCYIYIRWQYPSKQKTIPLAGGISLALLGIYSSHWLGLYKSIYYL